MGIDYQRMMDNPEDFVDYLDNKLDSLVRGLIEERIFLQCRGS